jgi:hypothetical protein
MLKSDPSSSKALVIPSRTSSKRVHTTLEENLRETIEDVRCKQKKLKAHSSHDSEFWSTFAEYKKLEHQCTDIRRKISVRDFIKHENQEPEWYDTPEGA